MFLPVYDTQINTVGLILHIVGKRRNANVSLHHDIGAPEAAAVRRLAWSDWAAPLPLITAGVAAESAVAAVAFRNVRRTRPCSPRGCRSRRDPVRPPTA